MNLFIKTVAAVLITAVFSIILAKQGKDIAVLLIMAVCCMVACIALEYLRDILDFLQTLENKGNLNKSLMAVLLKAVGIGLISEISQMICHDSGNAALEKILQILSSAVILWLCIPLFTELLNLVESVLSAV